MKRRSALLPLLAVVAAVVAPTVAAQVPDVSVTTPTLTVPEVTVPDVTVPSVTDPIPAPAPPSAPAPVPAPAPAPSAPSVSSVLDVSGATGSIAGGGGGGGDEGATSRARDARRTPTPKDPELRASRKKFKNRREQGEPYGTTLSFWLNRPGTVRLFIRREAPTCDPIGVISVRAEPGVNRVRFLGRWKGEPLPPGTYSVTGVVVRGDRARSIGSVRLVIVGPNQDTEDARMQRSRCGAPPEREAKEAVAAMVASDGASPGATAGGEDDAATAQGVAATTVSSSSGSYEVLGRTPRDEGATGGGFLAHPFDDAPPWLQALLLSALALAIVLLAAAALPARTIHPTGAAVFVADRRTQLALGGAVVLGTVAISVLLV